MSEYHLAEVNIARMLAPIDDPVMADFVANLDRINALADQAAGFVWRLQTEDGDATALRVFDDDMLIVNMSVWTSVETLFDYTYHSQHVEILRRRKEWFSKLGSHYLAMWWVKAGTLPTTQDAQARLAHFDQHGPTPWAFNFQQRFSIQDMLDYQRTSETNP